MDILHARLMTLFPRRLCASILFALGLLIPVFSAPLERSISTSRQFIVYGATTPLRGMICDLAEKTKANLLGVLQKSEQWKTPIVVNLQFPQANLPDIPPVARYFSQTGSGLKLQLDLVIRADVDAPALQRELLRAILLEMIYRGQTDLPAGSPYVEPPDWLVEGVLAAAPGQDRAPLVEALTPLLASNKIMSLEEFLRRKPELLDAPARSVYRGYALSLLQLLVDQPGGAGRLSRYIDDLSHASNDPLADLKTHFPILANASNLNQLWKSAVAGLRTRSLHQLLTFAETERRLDGLLQDRFSGGIGKEKGALLEDLATKKPTAAQKAELNRLSQNLLLLAVSSNPVMRPIVTEYQNAAHQLASGKKGGRVAERLRRLKTTRTRLVARMTAIEDYMNWFEATQATTASGAFADYLTTAGKSIEPAPRRRDAISVYLDALETQFQN